LQEFDQVEHLPQPANLPAYTLAEGELVAGRYRITRLIGRGGMGEVYQAQDQLLHEDVALKTMRAELSRNHDYVRRFQKEIQLARKVTHPNVCRVFEVGVWNDGPAGRPPLHFFTMELLTGETLSARIRRLRRLSREQAFPLAVQMAEGLQAAHDVGIVHTDFKSGNVVLIPGAEGDRAVITDFGLARHDPGAAAPDETVTMSAEGHLVGTVAYMSPEQMRSGAITPASDIYSFGIVLFEMATGKLPFDESHLINAAVQRVSGGGIAVRSLAPDIDARWEAAIEKCLQTEPRRRFASAADLADWFREDAWRLPRLHWTRREWIGAGAATGASVLAGGWYWNRSRRPYQPSPVALGWYRTGLAALRSMTYEAARKALEQAVAADPQFALAHASLARAYDELDRSGDAKDSMLLARDAEKATRLSSADARNLRAQQLVILRQYDSAVRLFQEMESEASPADKPAAALESGWLAEKREDTEGAASAYARAVQLDPRYAAAKLRLGHILERRGRLDQALAMFQDAEDLYNASSDWEGVTETLIERANLLSRRSNRAAQALPVIEKALSTVRTVGNPYQEIILQLLQGVAARSLHQTAQALDLTRRAVDAAAAQRMENLRARGLNDLGNIYLEGVDLEHAEPILREALNVANKGKVPRYEARASFSLASAFEDNRPKEAKQLVEEHALPFYRPAGYRLELVRSLTVLGGALAQLGEFDRGVQVLREEALPGAIQLQDARTEQWVHERLGANLRGQGNWPEAVKEYEKAWNKSGSQSGGARLDCAELYSWLGRAKEAQDALSEVEGLLKRNPNPALQFDLGVYQAAIAYQDGRTADAQRYLSQARAAVPGAGSDRKAKLIEALVSIRKGEKGGRDAGQDVILGLDNIELAFDAASARLLVAQALAESKDKPAALSFARDGLPFFDQRRIYESVWRAYSILAAAAQEPAVAKTYASKAGEAMAQLKNNWPPDSLDGYLRRSDIKPLYAGGKF
jgi:tetratricopeptide (TPR) repeat protein